MLLYSKIMDNKLNLFTVGDLIDTVIVNLSVDIPVDKTALQKGVFLYLLSYSRRHNLKFKDMASLIGFEPYKFGPFSDFIEGELETMKLDSDVKIIEDKTKTLIHANRKALDEYKMNNEDRELLENVKDLIGKLTTNELVFFVYFNPDIYKKLDGDVREYFISNSEIKNNMIQKKEYYIKKLLEKQVIDDATADVIRYDIK